MSGFRTMTWACVLITAATPAYAWTWTTLDYPGASNTHLAGIDGDNIIGSYYDGSGTLHNFLYDGTTWMTLDYPGASDVYFCGISGSNILARHHEGSTCHIVLYDGTNWKTLDFPGSNYTYPVGISGNNIVGQYRTYDNTHHYCLYDGETWSTLAFPVNDATVFGMDGDKIIGSYYEGDGTYRGFLYDDTHWTTFGFPHPGWLVGLDVSGTHMAGYSYFTEDPGMQSFSWYYSDGKWTRLHVPGANSTWAMGISDNKTFGNNVVGYYVDASGSHGFVLTIPEPATLLLLLGGLIVTRRSRH